MSERITREEARTAAAHLQELIAEKGTLAQRLGAITVVNFLHQPPENPDPVVEAGIEKLLHQLDAKHNKSHWICGFGDGTWNIAALSFNMRNWLLERFVDPSSISVKLREMVEPPAPTLDEVAAISFAATSDGAFRCTEEDMDMLQRHVAALREKEAKKNFTHRDETSKVKAGNTKISKRPPYSTSRK